MNASQGYHELYEYYLFLSNKFAIWMLFQLLKAWFLLDGIYWLTAEHYFQSENFLDMNLKLEIADLASPMESTIYGRNKKHLRPDWEYIKVEVMRCALYNKFNQNHDINEILISTRNSTLVEHTKNDSYWRDGGNGTGGNMPGKLLMELRDNIINNKKHHNKCLPMKTID